MELLKAEFLTTKYAYHLAIFRTVSGDYWWDTFSERCLEAIRKVLILGAIAIVCTL